jgi:hypothetical protein
LKDHRPLSIRQGKQQTDAAILDIKEDSPEAKGSLPNAEEEDQTNLTHPVEAEQSIEHPSSRRRVKSLLHRSSEVASNPPPPLETRRSNLTLGEAQRANTGRTKLIELHL